MPNVTRRDRADAIRFLSIDAVQKANSGHPGMPMGMADIAEVLWYDFLKHNPRNPKWINRDRFVLSNGHGSMLQYALLHLTGYDLSLDDIKAFRQLHSKTPGHPEYGETPGVETTTGPLGQGFANAVGMAIAEKHLAAVFNRPEFAVIDHYTYCFVGDGCLMEGISHEVASLAGTLGLGKLIIFYDDNQISIDGDVSGWFTDNTPERFEAYHWHVIPNIDGHDSEAIRQAILKAQSVTDKPTIICCKTTIGYGSPNKSGTASTHGSALGEHEVSATRAALDWPHEPFLIEDKIYDSWNAEQAGEAVELAWKALLSSYKQEHPALAREFERRFASNLPEGWTVQAAELVKCLNDKQQTMATRKASQACLNDFAPYLSELMGGSADLTESNCTNWKGMELFSADYPKGRYLHYGVREFGMSAIMNGLAVHGGILPFGGTFLTFSDYARNALRMAAIMQQRVIFVYTHDSIGLGEDGPTHQPIEHLTSLRLVPGLSVWRPCDTVETAISWQAAIEHHGPTCLVLSRQNLAFQARSSDQIALIKRGGYILRDTSSNARLSVIMIATGSEVELATAAAQLLSDQGIGVRVVSMPSVDVFLAQDQEYRAKVLPESCAVRIVIEAASGIDWYRFTGAKGRIIGINHFGVSAPAKDAFREFGFTVDHVLAVTKEALNDQDSGRTGFTHRCVSGLGN